MPLYLLNYILYDVPSGSSGTGNSGSGNEFNYQTGGNGISEMFSAFFNVLNIQYSYGGFTFSLYDVFKYQLIMILVGICIVKIWFFATDYFSNPLNYRSN